MTTETNTEKAASRRTRKRSEPNAAEILLKRTQAFIAHPTSRDKRLALVSALITFEIKARLTEKGIT